MDRRSQISRAHSIVIMSEHDVIHLHEPKPENVTRFRSSYWSFLDRRNGDRRRSNAPPADDAALHGLLPQARSGDRRQSQTLAAMAEAMDRRKP